MKKLAPEIKVIPPGPKARKLIQLEEKHASSCYIKEYPLVVERGEGPWIYDVDGNRYLDFMAGIAVTSTGHSHPKVIAAVKETADKFLHICGSDFYYETFTKLCAKLTSYVPKMGSKHVFLTNSGTEAVEAAIKLSRHHTKRMYIIAFKGSFHGRTMGALSLTCSKARQRAFFGPLIPGVIHVPYPNPYRCPDGAAQCGDDCWCSMRIEEDVFATQVDPKEVAAIFIEPIQGEGGYIVPPIRFLKKLRQLCDEHGILLVFDEVQSGVGRTGQMYAAETFGIAPDIFTTSKGLGSGMPIGAVVAKQKVMTWPRGSHGSTFGGNPVCCAAALATLEVVEKLLPNVRKSGEYLLRKLKNLQKKYDCIGDVRGKGLMIGVEFVEAGSKKPATDLTHQLEQQAFRKGLLLLSCGKSTIRFAPPLIVSNHEVDIGLDIFEECLKELSD